jgi:hypothetical protein
MMTTKTIKVRVLNGRVVCGNDGGNVRIKKNVDDVAWVLETTGGTTLPEGSYLVVDVVPLLEEDAETPPGNAVRLTTRRGGRAQFPAGDVSPGIYKYSVTVMPAGYTVDPIIIVDQ